MKECPACGFVFKKSKANKPWVEFEYTKDNFYIFQTILRKTLAYLRANELSKNEVPELENAMRNRRSGIPIPLDLIAKSEVVRMSTNILICSILEYFHATKTAPKNCIRIKDTLFYSKLEKVRHFSAHVIIDRAREGKALEGISENDDIWESFADIANELLIFVTSGIDKYVEVGKLPVSDLRSTEAARELLKAVNVQRKAQGKPIFN